MSEEAKERLVGLIRIWWIVCLEHRIDYKGEAWLMPNQDIWG